MKPNSKKIALLFFLAFCLCFAGLQAQTFTKPYPIKNTTGCDIIISYEVEDQGCVAPLCEISSPTLLIPAGSAVTIGSSCGTIIDIHIVPIDCGGVSLPGSSDFGYISTCINSTNTAPAPFSFSISCNANCLGGATVLKVDFDVTGTKFY